MKIFFPLDGAGCRVVVGQGFLDGFNDDHPDSNLRGLTGATFSFDGEFQLTNIQLKNGDPKALAGPALGRLIAIVRDWAQHQKPPKQSGFRQAFKLPWVVEPTPREVATSPPTISDRSEPHKPAAPWYEKDPDYDYRLVHGSVLVRRRKMG